MNVNIQQNIDVVDQGSSDGAIHMADPNTGNQQQPSNQLLQEFQTPTSYNDDDIGGPLNILKITQQALTETQDSRASEMEFQTEETEEGQISKDQTDNTHDYSQM